MCGYQFLGGFPTANLTSNPQKKASHRKFNLKNCAIKGYAPQYIVVCFFEKIDPLDLGIVTFDIRKPRKTEVFRGN